MKKIFKAGWVILALGAVLAIVGAAFNGVKAVEFNGFKVQTVKKDTAITKTYAKKEFERIEFVNGSGYFVPMELEIRQGQDYSVSYSGSSRFEPKIDYQNGTLKVARGQEMHGFSFDFNDYRSKIDSKLIITVPENVKLSFVKVNGNYDNIKLEKLNIATLELEANSSEKLSLNEVTTERTDIDMNTDEVTITNSKLNNGELSLDRVADLIVSGGELTNINVKVDSEGRVYYKDGLVLNGGGTQLADEVYGYASDDDNDADNDSDYVDNSEPSADLYADTITIKGKYEIKNNDGATRIMNATVQGYRLTNKHGKNNLHDQQQTNGGTLEENADQADVLTLSSRTGENTVK